MNEREEMQTALSAHDLVDLIEEGPEAVHCFGMDGTLLWANRADMDLLGYAPGEYIGRNIADFHADRDVILDVFRRLARGETLHNQRARLRCKDGSLRHVLLDANVRFDEQGRFVHARCFTRNVTNLAAANAQEDVWAIVTHDLRNPLGVIALKAEHLAAILDSQSDKGLTEHVAAMTRAAAQMERMIRDLVEFSTMQAGTFHAEPRPHSAIGLARRAVEAASVPADHRRLRLDFALDGDVAVLCDGPRTIHVLASLIANAVRFTTANGSIVVATRRDGDAVCFEVTDDGVAFEEDQLPHLFEPRQLSSRRGLGVSLTVAKAIAEAQGGGISVENGASGGAVFKLRVPLSSA